MKQDNKILTVIIITVFLFNIVETIASINIRASLDKLVLMSTHIAVGKVTKITSRWNDDNSRIITDLKFEITQTVSGDFNTQLITIELPGGTVDEISTIIVDGASFKEGEEALLFLKEILPESIIKLPHYRLADLTQGKYRILKDNGKVMAISETIDRVRLLADENGESLPPGGEDGIEIETFIINIKTIKKP